ncbi:hypothetical protein F4775DRAFT_535242 [Biscogniauxia sp. FL1348]|nr:hypothetical protein F4775DRAFT_535242 [Biscogniauxia sp. FL1348]
MELYVTRNKNFLYGGGKKIPSLGRSSSVGNCPMLVPLVYLTNLPKCSLGVGFYFILPCSSFLKFLFISLTPLLLVLRLPQLHRDLCRLPPVSRYLTNVRYFSRP